MAAWLSSKDARESATRTVSGTTLDGYRLVAELTVVFHHALAPQAAEALGNEVAAAAEQLLADQISQGDIPFSPLRLAGMLTSRSVPGAKRISRIDVTSFRVAAQPRKAPDRAVVPRAGGAPSTPAGPSHESARPAPKASSVFRSPSGPMAAAATASVASSPPSPGAAAASETAPPAAPAAATAVATTAPPRGAATPTVPPGGSTAGTAPPAAAAVAIPSTAPARPPSTAPHTSISPPASAPPRSTAGTGLAPGVALREATAAALLATLGALRAGVVDRLSLLEGAAPMPALWRETCACFAAATYHAMISASIAHKTAVRLIEAMCVEALSPYPPPANEIGYYLSNPTSTDELAERLAALLSVPPLDTNRIHTALSGIRVALMAELTAAAMASVQREPA